MKTNRPCPYGTNLKFITTILTIIAIAIVITCVSLVQVNKVQANPNDGVFEIRMEKDSPIKLSRSDFEKLIYTVEQEAHDLSPEHKMMIAQVIINRKFHKAFPNTVGEVLAQKGQFQGYINYKTKKHIPTVDTILACKKVLNAGKVTNVMFFYNRDISHPKHRKFFENNAKLTHVKTLEGHRFFAMN